MRKQTLTYIAIALLGGFSALALESYFVDSHETKLAAQHLSSPFGGEQRALAPSVQFDRYIQPEQIDQTDVAPQQTASLKLSEQTTVPVNQSDFQERLASLSPEERAPVEIYASRNKSVVNVSTQEKRSNWIFQQTAEGCGSGIVLNREGVVLTNFHVVENVSKIEVTLFDGSSYPAKLLGVDPNTDVALLQISAPQTSLFPIEFGDSSQLLVGQTVYAIGNPFGLERTMTKGIVSNLNRSIGSPQQFRQIKGVIQVDAAINPGNSGGVLLDSRGKMIGMNTAIASRVGENSGVGFAIPVNTIQRIVSILLERGQVIRGDAGVVQVTETEQGLIPGLIDAGGAADEAGLRGGKIQIVVSRSGGALYKTQQVVRPEEGFDLIAGVNGQRVKTGEDFITAVEEHAPGETITLNIIRNGKQMDLPIVLK